jgi:tryptophan-rich sensory protein
MIWLQRKKKASRFALWVYLLQVVLNSVWSLLFFGLQRPDLALGEIAILLGMIISTIVLFCRIDTRAGALLIP